MDNTDNYRDRKKRRSARERRQSRRKKRAEMASPIVENTTSETNKRSIDTSGMTIIKRIQVQALPLLGAIASRIGLLLRDGIWYLRNNPMALRGVMGMVGIGFLFFIFSFIFSGDIFPNIKSMGISLSGMSVGEAEERLTEAWYGDIEIDLYAEGEFITAVRPETLGISLDAEATARSARSAGLSGIPFGSSVDPSVDLDYPTAQSYLLSLGQTVDSPALNAGYQWSDGQVIGTQGQTGRRLDVTLTLDRLTHSLSDVANSRRLDLMVENLRPTITDPSSYLTRVQELANTPFELVGFDPYTNQRFIWTVPTEVFIPWLEAGQVSLGIRESAFLPYVDQLNASLNSDGDNSRYILADEAVEHLNEAIALRAQEINLRVRYRDFTYEVASGDTVHAIARRTGVPFYLIQERNNGRNLDSISPGDLLSIPSRDVTMPNTPVPAKRIIVDLNNQYLYAFENGQIVFEWSISSGVENAPTSPGIYQVLSHEEVAYGSSNTLCDSAGLVCGQWEMHWFMGIYEVTEGLENGFHGDVLLPNGNWLGAGGIGTEQTFGCVMSDNHQAQSLYEWAEIGTVVEIISNEFEPMSDLGRMVWNNT